jgi:starch phosphorylase
MLNEFTQEPRIAYFTMEMAIQNEIPTYSGGLGVLAGDTMNSCADLELPLVAVTLVSRSGYFRQEINEQGNQVESPDLWEPGRWATPLGAMIAVTIEGREVWIRGWLYILKGHLNGRVPIILLDTDLDENSLYDRKITDFLYGGMRPIASNRKWFWELAAYECFMPLVLRSAIII